VGIQVIGPGGSVAEVNSAYKTLRTALYPANGLGYYRLSAISGLITTVAAATATAGHLFAFRNTSATLIIPTFLSVKWRTITGFTAAQEVGFDVVIARGYTASHTGGTAISTASNGLKKRTNDPTSVLGDARIATTGALTAGTHTLDAQPMLQEAFADLAAAATVPKARADSVWDMTNGQDSLLVLAQNEGLVIRNSILMGTAGTARLIVDMSWIEATAYP